jgi:hypothetical protein
MVVAMSEFSSDFQNKRARLSCDWLRGLCTLRCGLDRFNDVLVASAATDVSGQRHANDLFARIWLTLKKFIGGHEEPRSTEATLQSLVVSECFLDWMHLAITGHSLDRHHFMTVGLDSEHQARAYALTIHKNRACTAGTVFASNIGTAKPEILA